MKDANGDTVKQCIELRYVWLRGDPYKPPHDSVLLIEDDEWIVNVETVPPNPSTGSGIRAWIARLRP